MQRKVMQRIKRIVLTLLFVPSLVLSQQTENDVRTALLIIDIQNFYFPGEGPGLVGAEEASLNAKEVLEIFRAQHQLVVHVRHKSARGSEIHKNVEPIAYEKVITKEEVNSFVGTDLLEYLNVNNISRLVIIGMQTQMCIEAAVRAGHDYGFECIVIQDVCATRDLTFMGKTVKAEDVHISTLATLKDGGYAKVLDLQDFKENVDRYLYQKLN
ncbi:MAG: cysteine hydrolase [Lentimicrobiaceae bacterium]|nr:cysteine hydrolase [Lentimicrobiaceae bacterium]